MELDTGAFFSVLNEDTYKSIQQQSYIAPHVKTTNKLCSYTGDFIQVLGVTEVKARYGGKELVLPIHVVNDEVNFVEANSPLGEVLDKH